MLSGLALCDTIFSDIYKSDVCLPPPPPRSMEIFKQVFPGGYRFCLRHFLSDELMTILK